MGLRLSWEKKKKRKHKLVQTIRRDESTKREFKPGKKATEAFKREFSKIPGTKKERVLNQIAQLRRLEELAARQGNEKKVQEYRQRLKDFKESLK